jgi:DNA-binding transcriptional LysR family regulator
VRSLSRIDLNLLLALHVLLEERSVTRAARRMAVSQSAMSQTLGRLRDALDDPLLLREGNRMVPSPRAEQLADPLSDALRALEAVVSGSAAFDAARTERRFVLAAHDYNTMLLLPTLLPALRAEAPGVELQVVPFVPSTILSQLRDGSVDLALSVARDLPSDLTWREVIDDHIVGLADAAHPIHDGPLDLARFAAYPHGLITVLGYGPGRVDHVLEAAGLARPLRVRTPYFSSVAQVLLGTDLVMAVPQRLARSLVDLYDVATFELPFEPMAFTLSLVWSRRFEADPGHRWFRELTARCC